MSSFDKFEDIEAWKKARELTTAIYAATNGGSFARDFGLRDQIRRAAVSTMANIAEGFGRGGNKEFIQFLSVAKCSVSEIQSQLYVALDACYLNQTHFEELYTEADTTARLIGGLLRYLQNNDFKGSKYK
ncbi:four helix bundle protein [Desulfosarcina sp.]|uniref:four helix bundle protein n=1 Tax=Desulfosarcina sp. TaxID=2027861 RepID=UPI00356ADE05